jgi:hypothetical protein
MIEARYIARISLKSCHVYRTRSSEGTSSRYSLWLTLTTVTILATTKNIDEAPVMPSRFLGERVLIEQNEMPY